MVECWLPICLVPYKKEKNQIMEESETIGSKRKTGLEITLLRQRTFMSQAL
jgi:hypothetical protein